MTDTPYNFVSGERFKQSKTSTALTQHRDNHGFSSWGFATKKQAASDGLTLRQGESGKYAYVQYENGNWYEYFNEEQFDLA